MESCGKDGETPVIEIRTGPRVSLSNTPHVKRCMNLRRPLRKAKY